MRLGKRGFLALSAILSVGLTGIIVYDVYADWQVEGKALWSTLLENAIPMALGVGIFLGGYWVYTKRAELDLSVVTRWQYIGAAGVSLIALEVVGIQMIQGELKPWLIVLQMAIGGAVAGTVLGYSTAGMQRTQTELQDERDRFEALFENTPAEVVEITTAEGEGPPRIVGTNSAFRETFADGNDASGTPLFDVVAHDEDTEAAIRDAIARGDTYETDMDTATREGRRYFQLRVVPYGSSQRAYLLYTDVTDLEETQRELEETLEEYRQMNDRLDEYREIIETVPIGIVQTEAGDHNQFHIANDEFLELFDADSMNDFMNIELDRVYANQDRRAEILQQLEETGEIVDEEVRFRTLDGDEFWGSITARIVDTESGEYLVAAVFDITERRQYKEQLEKSNDRLQQFAYVASHDLQEPLRMVSSYVSLLESEYGDELDDEADEYIEFAVDGAERMQDMIDGLLEYSRVRTEGEAFTRTDANDVLEDTLKDLEFLIDEEDATVTAEDLPAVEADRNQLGQVFQNLIENAIDHGGKNTTVDVSAERRDGQVVFAVADDGPGIPDDQQDRIFEIFEQGERDANGTGIGLAICDRIVSRHGGEMWVESGDSDGATFYFTMESA